MTFPPDVTREIKFAIQMLTELNRLAGSFPDAQKELLGLYAKAIPIIERLKKADDLDSLEVCKQQCIILQAEAETLKKETEGDKNEAISFAADALLDAVKCVGQAKINLRKVLART